MNAMTIMIPPLFALSSGLLLLVVLEMLRLRRGLDASRMMHRQAVEARVAAEERLAAAEHDRTDWKDRATIAESQVNRLASRLEHAEAYGARQHEHMLAEKGRYEIERLRIVVLRRERDAIAGESQRRAGESQKRADQIEAMRVTILELQQELARWRPGRLPDGRFVKVMEAVQ